MKLRIVFASLLLVTLPAFAYIDPGTGSFLLQGVIATVLTASFAIKRYWHKFISLFRKKQKTDDLSQEE